MKHMMCEKCLNVLSEWECGLWRDLSGIEFLIE